MIYLEGLCVAALFYFGFVLDHIISRKGQPIDPADLIFPSLIAGIIYVYGVHVGMERSLEIKNIQQNNYREILTWLQFLS